MQLGNLKPKDLCTEANLCPNVAHKECDGPTRLQAYSEQRKPQSESAVQEAVLTVTKSKCKLLGSSSFQFRAKEFMLRVLSNIVKGSIAALSAMSDPAETFCSKFITGKHEVMRATCKVIVTAAIGAATAPKR